MRDTKEQLSGSRHRAQVRAEIDGVGDEEQRDAEIEHGLWIVFAKRIGKAAAGLQGDARAYLLDGSHQRKSKERRPELSVSKLRAGLGMRANARGIVVGCAGDEPWTQRGEVSFCFPPGSSALESLLFFLSLRRWHG